MEVRSVFRIKYRAAWPSWSLNVGSGRRTVAAKNAIEAEQLLREYLKLRGAQWVTIVHTELDGSVLIGDK